MIDKMSLNIMVELYILYRNLDDEYLEIFPSPAHYYRTMSEQKRKELDQALYDHGMSRPVSMTDSIEVQYLKTLYHYRYHPAISVLYPKTCRWSFRACSQLVC